jgi:DNA-binding response OmpR family regulator
MISVLVVEDEPSLRADLVDYLTLKGLKARGAASGAAFRTAVAAEPPQIVILDVGLPDADGFELAEEIRRTADLGIIMLTALAEPEDRVRGFEAGADIYLMKQATLREIEAAVLSLARRLSSGASTGSEQTGLREAWSLDREGWWLTAPDGSTTRLTATEFAFLDLVLERAGEPISRDELVRQIARPIPHWDSRHLDSIISRLRRKVQTESGRALPVKMIYGKGYAFTASVKPTGH